MMARDARPKMAPHQVSRAYIMILKTRFNVVISMAKGLVYLHHCCGPLMIHDDIKPINILLDSEFRAKIGDFGLARVKEEARVLAVEEEVHNRGYGSGEQW
ncbi:hypothetical protein S83_003915 [Arachis hypogaea]